MSLSALLWRRGRQAVALCALLLCCGLAMARGPLYLWELRDADGALRAWLYGTIHVCDAACFPLPAEVRGALEGADSLALELDPDDPELGPRLGEAAALPEGARLDALLPAALRPRLAAVAARSGVPDAMLQRLQPWMANAVLSLRAAQIAGFSVDQGVDLWLARAIRARGQAPWALERVERQVAAMQAGGPAAQVASLAETVALIESGGAEAYFGAMLEAWRHGDVARMDYLMREEIGSPEMAPLMAELLDRRNVEMADAIVARLEAGKRPFVAVGAGHFGGAGGLLELLAARGFRLRQVESAAD